jgi:hypothetical protein
MSKTVLGDNDRLDVDFLDGSGISEVGTSRWVGLYSRHDGEPSKKLGESGDADQEIVEKSCGR